MKITTWNVNSINARIEDLIKFIKKDSSDIYLIQELKCINEEFPYEKIQNLICMFLLLYLQGKAKGHLGKPRKTYEKHMTPYGK